MISTAYFLEHGLATKPGEDWEPGEEEGDWPDEKTAHRAVCDFIAGMTDRYALNLFEHIFLPKPWSVDSPYLRRSRYCWPSCRRQSVFLLNESFSRSFTEKMLN